MKDIVTTKAFRKDIKRMRKRGKDMGKLENIVSLLCEDKELEHKYKVHPLLGDWKPLWDLHIEPDWLLIYQLSEAELYLARTGSHSDLFD